MRADRTYDRWESMKSVLWDLSGGEYSTGHFKQALEFYAKDGILAYAYTYGDVVNGFCRVDSDGKENFIIPDGRYIVMGSACAKLRDGEFHIGLSPLPPELYPIVYHGEAVADTLKFNGYITSVK